MTEQLQETENKVIRKGDFIRIVSDLSKYHNYEVEDVLGAFFYALKQAMLNGDDVILEGVGKTFNYIQPARTIRHPVTGEVKEYPAVHKVKFEVSPSLKAQLKKKEVV